MLYAGQYVTFVTSTSSAHNVTITGEPASAYLNVQYDLYLTTIQGNAPDDFHSNFIQCDSSGNFTHYANNSSAPGALTATYRYSADSYTSSATSDIYNLGNTSQKGHDSSSTSFTVVYP